MRRRVRSVLDTQAAPIWVSALVDQVLATYPDPPADRPRCAVHGWRSQVRGQVDFAAYLLGRVSWAASLDPVLGARLREAYRAIDWR